ncbi:MAG: hypothetical protein M3Z17_10365 [Gemmatimonadota bacterium]|nr:hypothetical protein [Gemmatimonadota bacterium]
MRTTNLTALAVAFASAACASVPQAVSPPPVVIGADTIPIPINELGARTYRGVQGGLYPGGANLPSADLDALGVTRRDAIKPLGANGLPSPSGRYVLMSVGAGNASASWCSISSAPPCDSWSLAGRAASDPSVNRGPLVIVNGAIAGAEFDRWSNPSSQNYVRIRDTRLAPLGLSENQVQAIWMGIPDSGAAFPLSASAADAAPRLQRMGTTIRALKKRYPNLQLLFISSGAYRGYSATGEPAAYESGFIVKWAIESQVNSQRMQPQFSDAGDLSISSGSAPWIAWGPYVWARGAAPRADGVAWLQSDFDADGSSLSPAGAGKLGSLLLDFFKTSPYTRCWFLAGPVCG